MIGTKTPAKPNFGMGLVLDDDDDGDGTLDAYDPSPRIANNFVIDTDNDGIADY